MATKESVLGMDTECELASELTAYIIHNFTNAPLEHMLPNGDYAYHELAQDVFIHVLDLISDVTGVPNE